MSGSDNNDNKQPKEKEKKKPKATRGSSRTCTRNLTQSIELSKQLSTKRKLTRVKVTKANNNGIRITQSSKMCGNGKPMPSLAELEKMYEDSDVEDNDSTNTTKEETELSSESIQEMASNMLKVLSNIVPSKASTILVEDNQPSQVVPQKKSKKSDIPYIVGCKDRPRVKTKCKVNFSGGNNYGVHPSVNTNDDKDVCSKRRKTRSRTKLNLSKSIFNAQTDEILEKLKESENSGESSCDSCKTESYDYPNETSSINHTRAFSPLPSTSRDDDTFLKNVKRFNESLNVDESSDVIIRKNNHETIVIDDSLEEGTINNTNTIACDDNDCIEIKEIDNTVKNDIPTVNCESLISVDDYYGSINTEESVTQKYESEVIDVDAIIAENKVIIDKYTHDEKNNNVINVEPDSKYLKSPMLQNKSVDSRTQTSNSHSILSDNVNVVKDIVKNYFSALNSNHNSARSMDINENVGASTSLGQRDFEIRDCVDSINRIYKTRNYRVDDTSVKSLNSFVTPLNINEQTSLSNNNDSEPVLITDNIDLTDNDSVVIVGIIPPKNQNSDIATQSSCGQLTGSISDHDYILSTTVMTDQRPRRRKKTPNKLSSSNSAQDSVQPESSRNIGDCPICLENLATKAVASTICGHIFCMDCIKVALKSGGKRCPNCRKVLKGAGYHQLFL